MSWNSLENKYHDETIPEIALKTGELHNTVIKDEDAENEKDYNIHMKLHPELYRSDILIYASYTGPNCSPYHVVCRRRAHKTKKLMTRQFNREISHMAMMQSYAIAGVRIERNFSVGFSPGAVNVQDFATNNERRRINLIMVKICEICFAISSKKDIYRFYIVVERRLSSSGTRMSVLDRQNFALGTLDFNIRLNIQVENGYIRRVTDNEINSLALEVAGTNVSTTYIYTPKDRREVLGIELAFLIMVIKNMRKYFTFEITILDDKKMHRRFRVSNFQSTTKVRPFGTSMPMGLSGGWNQIQFNLADFCKRAYGSNYIETTRMQIHANCRIRRIYFADRLYRENELPDEYRVSGIIRKCMRESDKKRQAEQNSKTCLSHTSIQSRASSGFHNDGKSLSTILSEASKSSGIPNEHTKLQIDIPAAEYEGETDNLSTERSSVRHNKMIEEQNLSELSLVDNREEHYTSPTF